MKILVLNCGSSSLKFRVFELEENSHPQNISRGLIKRIGTNSGFEFRNNGSEACSGSLRVMDHRQAVRLALNWIADGECSLESKLLTHDLDGVGHRVVHGGDRFTAPIILDREVISEISALAHLAPLHNPVSLEGIRAAEAILGSSIPMVAVFDTGYHDGIPEYASIYAIPYELTRKHNIKRYGPHGIAHRYMALRCAEMAGKPLEEMKLITLQLGNGSSIAAIKGGQHIDTSMGFTPLEGLVMGTRSGDLDPAILFFLARKEGFGIDALDDLLNFKSGLLGISGVSNDMGKVLESTGRSFRSRLAVEVFCYRIKKYIGSYLAVLEGADAIVFGGGIGENAVSVREAICNGLGWCGLKIDPARNRAAQGCEMEISAASSQTRVFVIQVDEELLIAKETAERVENKLHVLPESALN